MAEVHNLSAVDLSVHSSWLLMETFPQDGHAYEVRDIDGNTSTAVWLDGEFRCSGPAHQLTHWRNMEES